MYSWLTNSKSASSEETDPEKNRRPAPATSETEDNRRTRSQRPSITISAAATTSETFEAITLQAQEAAAARQPRSANRLTPRECLQQHRDRSRSRGQSPSPLTQSSSSSNFEFPPNKMADSMTSEQIERICANAVRMALDQDREERDRQSRLATEAAVSAALANQTQQVQALRRPELPPFDKENVEVWIRRLENAYTRSNITKPKDKFAFLEKLFHAKDDARINSFIWHTNPTAEIWQSFLDYIKERHGRTKEQEVHMLLNGIPRDGRRPIVLYDHIKEMTSQVTLDAIRKEVFLKQMPAEVRQHINDRVDDLDFEGVAKACDKHFDKAGKLKDAKQPSAISNISSIRPSRSQQQQPQQTQQQQQQQQPQPKAAFTSPFPSDDDETDVNAVRFKSGQKQTFKVSNRSPSRGRNNSNFNSNRSNSNANRTGGYSSSNSGSSNTPSNGNKICRHHIRFGEESWRCEGSWCLLKSKVAPKGQANQ